MGWVRSVRSARSALPSSGQPPSTWFPGLPLASRAEALVACPGAVARLVAAESWAAELDVFFDHCRQRGVGCWGRYRAFRWQGAQLRGIAQPDPVRLDQLFGYDLPKQQLLANTERLLRGQPALNVLLYGSRGAGKSSLVKALVNGFGEASQGSFAQRGLRLIEVAKGELAQLPAIAEQLRSVAQKFILFVDDLSFEADDEAFKALKVVLEGSASARPANLVVYATSNRRHLVREFFDDRPRPKDAAEIHQWDTVQEKLSFSDRFGLTLTFGPADQDEYLAIVRHLVVQAELKIEPADLEFRALQWATRHNGRSGRTAQQFVAWLQGENLSS
ncbi:MAG: ATP-binding protein [Synechococcales cyanobacterium RM1_1_8]|nr:ATP-binding protein [Synechococcales cyanobacterium RM1_1_8]